MVLSDADLYVKGSYSLDVVNKGNDHYIVTIRATDLKEHQNANHLEGYWVGVQIGDFSENVTGWRTAYKGYATTAAVDEALGGEEMIATSEDASPLAWYRDADKDSANNTGRDWTVGIQLLGESEGEEENVLKTVYVTFDVDNVDFNEESAEDTPTEPGADVSQGQEDAAEEQEQTQQ